LKAGDRFHLDSLDLMKDAERRRFVERAAEETGLHSDLLKRDISRLLFAAEQTQAELARPAEKIARAVVLSEEERVAAFALLRDPKLLGRILTDFAACGVVGEETNKLTGYLAAVSRKLDTPLAVIVQSTSAAGKTALMESVLAFTPPEERVKYSALTGQALYYMADADLKHKILAIVEEEGAEKASYALKLLQSEGELTIASTGKDPRTGRMETQEYRMEGSVMIFLTTTAVDIDEELLNRCLVLTVDESREQTRRIHAQQRARYTLEGIRATERKSGVLALHRNAQRLLRPYGVFNPWSDLLAFPDDKTRMRRDHMKYLHLIGTLALLRQYQREIRPVECDDGRIKECVVATLDDIADANRLAHEVLGRCLDEMPPQTRRLLELLEKMVSEKCAAAKMERADARFSRRVAREHIGWRDTQLKIHIGRLVDMEYLIAHRADHGGGFVYELAYDGGGKDGRRYLSGLLDVEKLRRSGSGRGSVGPRSGVGRPAQNGVSSSDNAAKIAPNGKNAHLDGARGRVVVVDADAKNAATGGRRV